MKQNHRSASAPVRTHAIPLCETTDGTRGWFSLWFSLWLSGALILGAGLWAAMAAANPVSTYQLENGLELVVIEDHRAPVVTHMVWYRVGAADEQPGKSGIAHFFEHLMFKSTENMASGEFSATVEAQGGNDNAFTSWDYTAYYQRVAADRLGLMMKMEAERMRNLILSDEVVDTERKVIIEERQQRIDSNPTALLAEQIQASQYLNHPYRIPIIGWEHEINALNRHDALAFYQRYYAPNNAIVVVSGDVQPDEVYKLAQEYYSPLAPSDGIVDQRARPTEPPQLAKRHLDMSDERVAQPYVVRSYLAPNRRSGDQEKAAATVFLAELLGGSGQTSLLAEALQYGPDPVAVYTSAYYNPTALDQTDMALWIVPAPGKSFADVETAVDNVLRDFIANGPNTDDFTRIKTQIRADDIYARDNVSGLARRYGAALTVGLSLDDIDRWPDVLQSITAEQVQSIAKDVLDARQSVTAYLRPVPSDTPTQQ